MTSNVGARDMVKGKALGFSQPDMRATFDKMAEKVKEEINKTFNPEFLNRLDDVIVFHPLTREHIAQIVTILLKEVQRRLGEEELTLRLTPAASDFLVERGYDEHFGARPLKRAIQKYVEDPLSEKILVGEFARGEEIEVDAAPDKERLAFRALSGSRSEEHTSELQSRLHLVCRLLLEKKKNLQHLACDEIAQSEVRQVQAKRSQ